MLNWLILVLISILKISISSANCPSASFYISELGIVVHLNETLPTNFAGTLELCEDGFRSLAYIECQGNSQWTLLTRIVNQCGVTANITLLNSIRDEILYGNGSIRFQDLPYSRFVIDDVTNLIQLYENISIELITPSRNYAPNEVITIKQALYEAYSAFFTFTEFLILERKNFLLLNQLVKSVENITENMIIASFNETEEYQTDAFLASIIPISLSLNIGAQNIDIEYSQNSTSNQTLINMCSPNGFCSNNSNTSMNNIDKIALSLDSKLIDILNYNLSNLPTIPHANFIYYKNTTYFTKNINNTAKPYQAVISVTISNYTEILNIIGNTTNLINITVTLNNATSSFWKVNKTLSFLRFNETGNTWSSEGCQQVAQFSNNITFSCNHLTHFAVLVDIEQFYGSSSSDKRDTNDLILSIITYLAISLSIIGLLITMLTFLCFKKLRAHYSQKCIFNLASALFFMYVVFIIDSALTEAKLINTQTPLCIVLAFFLHYFILASFLWMLIMAFIQYIMFVKIFPYYVSNFTIKASLICWGLPLVPVIITLSLNYSYNIAIQLPNHFIYGKIGNICWIQGLPFYLTVILPIGMILCLNGAVFIAVAVNLTCSTKSSIEMHEERNNAYKNSLKTVTAKATSDNKKAACTRLTTAVFSCFVILGLTWLFGFLAINQVRIVFSYLFCLCNASQGFLVLIAYVLMSKPKREMWVKKFKDIHKVVNNIGSSAKTSSEFDGAVAREPNNSSTYPNSFLKFQNSLNLKRKSNEINDTMMNRDEHEPKTVQSKRVKNPAKPKSPNRKRFPWISNKLESKDRAVNHNIHSANSDSSNSSQKTTSESIKNDKEIDKVKKQPEKKIGQKLVSALFRPNSLSNKSGTSRTSSSDSSNKRFSTSDPSNNKYVSYTPNPERVNAIDQLYDDKNMLKTSLGFGVIIPTPKNKKKTFTKENIATNDRNTFAIGHRSRLNSTQTQANNNATTDDVNRTITPSTISVETVSTMPGFVFDN